MAIATFSRELNVFQKNERFALSASVGLSDEKSNFGRITWSGDGKWLAAAPVSYGNGSLPIVGYKDDRLTPTRFVTLPDITSASFFNWTNRNIAVGNNTGEVFVWDIKEKKVSLKFSPKTLNSIDMLTVNSDDTYLAAGSLNQSDIMLYGLKTNKAVGSLAIPKSDNCSSLQFCSCKKNYLVASSFDSVICAWDIIRQEVIFKSLNSHIGACTDVSFSPVNFSVIASVGLTKMLKLFDLRDGRSPVLSTNINESMNCVDVLSDGEKVAVGTTSGFVVIYDLRSDCVYQTFEAQKESVLSVKMQSLKLPTAYQEVEMNTPDQVDTKSKSLDVSIIDIFSPISCSSDSRRSNNLLSVQSTPKINNANSNQDLYDSFLSKMESPLPNASPYTSGASNSRWSASPMYNKSFKAEYTEKLAPLTEQCHEESQSSSRDEKMDCDVHNRIFNNDDDNENGNGDGFHLNRTVVKKDASLDKILQELQIIRSEISTMKQEYHSDLTALKESNNEIKEELRNLKEYIRESVKKEIYEGNCNSKIAHSCLRILVSEIKDKMCEEFRLNMFRVNYVKNLLDDN